MVDVDGGSTTPRMEVSVTFGVVSLILGQMLVQWNESVQLQILLLVQPSQSRRDFTPGLTVFASKFF